MIFLKKFCFFDIFKFNFFSIFLISHFNFSKIINFSFFLNISFIPNIINLINCLIGNASKNSFPKNIVGLFFNLSKFFNHFTLFFLIFFFVI